MREILKNNLLKRDWENYNQIRIKCDKKSANKLLTEFINALKKEDEKVIKNFIDHLCELILEKENKIIDNNGSDVSSDAQRIQHPLFKEIIVPVLITEYKKESAKHIKWIGQFEQYFYSDKKLTSEFLRTLKLQTHFQAEYFFEKSFGISKNQNTLTLLLNKIAWHIDYYLHEVPLGVLVEPEVLNKEITIFRNYWLQSNTKEVWENRLVKWDKIANHWIEYNSMHKSNYSFEDYLENNKIRFD